MRVPSQAGRFNRLIQAIAWIVLPVYLLLQTAAFVSAPLHKYDDCIPLVSADLVLQGRIPGVDFWSFYPPLLYYLLCAGFKLISHTFLVARVIAIVLEAAVVFAAARFFASTFSELRRWTAFLLFPVAVALGILNSPPWPGYALALLSLLAYLHGRRSLRLQSMWIAFAGSLAGLSALIRFNFGPYVMLVVAVDILINETLDATAQSLRSRLRKAMLDGASFIIPFAIVNALVYMSIYGTSAAAIPWRTLRFTMGIMKDKAFLHLRPDPGTLLYLSFPWNFIAIGKVLSANKPYIVASMCVAFGAMMAFAALLARNSPSVAFFLPAAGLAAIVILHLWVSRLPRPALILLLFYICLQHYFLTRADAEHAILFYPVAALILPLLFTTSAAVDKTRQGFGASGLIVAALAAAACLLGNDNLRPHVSSAKTTLRVLLDGGLDPGMSDRDRVQLQATSLDFEDIGAELQATEFIRAKTAAPDRIYVGVTDHSSGFINSVRAYWLSERSPGCKYVDLDTTTGTMERVQREIIADLERNHVNWAILYDESGVGDDRLFEGIAPGSKVLDEYLMQNFREEARFGRYTVLSRIRT